MLYVLFMLTCIAILAFFMMWKYDLIFRDGLESHAFYDADYALSNLLPANVVNSVAEHYAKDQMHLIKAEI